MHTTPLQDLKIVEYASFVAGPYCAKLLGDMGAEVVKIEEPPTGDEARTRGPFPGDLPHPEKSGLFLYLNTNKLGITLNPRDPAGHDVLLHLLGEADVFVHDRTAARAESLGIDFPTLHQLNPRLIVTSVTPFGHTGPYAEYRAHNLNLCHAGSEGYMLPGGLGHQMFPHRPPLKLGGYTGDYDGGMAAAIGTMAAVLAREVWGRGQHVDASRQEANIALNRVAFVTYLSEGKVTRRDNRTYPFGGLYPTRDGHVVLRPTEDQHWRPLARAMGRPELADDPRFAQRAARIRNGEALNAVLAEWTRQHTTVEVYEAARGVGCPVAPFANAREIAESPQLEARGYFVEIDHPEAGRWPYPSAPYRFSKTPWSARRPAPLLGQHNQEVLGGRLGFTGEELSLLRANGVI
ncbi:MAG: CoA transferase [Dehalococcoidia bacterium]